jgi:hypothetical protein
MLTFSPGFRLSRLDIAFVIALITATIALTTMNTAWAFVVGFVGGNFFLFCNVFRVARPLELAWSALFLVLAGATILFEMPGWWITAGTSLGATAAVVFWEMRRPSYHGVGWRWINPGLPAWWKAEHNQLTGEVTLPR